MRTLRAQAVQSSEDVRFGDRKRKRMLFSLNVVTLGTIEMAVCAVSRLDAVVEPEAEFQRNLEIEENVPLLELEASFTPDEFVPVVAISMTQYFPLSSLLHIASDRGMSE